MTKESASARSMFQKMFLMGMGALSLTREKAEKLTEELVEKGEVSSEDTKGFIKELIDRGEQERDSLKRMIKDELNEMREGLGLTTLEQVNQLEQRIQNLEQRIAALEKNQLK